jgi:hypothetical protein
MAYKVNTFLRRYSVSIIAGLILIASFTLSAAIETTLAF